MDIAKSASTMKDLVIIKLGILLEGYLSFILMLLILLVLLV